MSVRAPKRSSEDSLINQEETSDVTIVPRIAQSNEQLKPCSSSALFKTGPITYSWNNMNVWGGVTQISKKCDVESQTSRFANCCRRKQKLVSKQILKNVSGIVKPGELLAIMGASGAGKTTLLNILTCRNASTLRVSGERKINGVSVTPDMITAVSAYVQQEDLFIPTLTVREHLKFQALVRMHRHLPSKFRMERVEEVITEFGLGKCADTIIGSEVRLKGISGGEMKRLSFASEVLTDCQLFFCDEPTSGLDSYMALNVVDALKNMAFQGRTIVCTIHQPSSEVYSLFDKILLMAEGSVAFLGTPNEALEFFNDQGFQCPSNYNPSDFFVQTLAIQPGMDDEGNNRVEKICTGFTNSELSNQIMEEINTIPPETSSFLDMQRALNDKSVYKASWFAQFRAVLWRSLTAMRKEPLVIRVRLVQTLLIAVILGAIYWQQALDRKGVMNINGALFLCLTNMTFQNVFAVINVFCGEQQVFLREHFNGMYRTDVYFICKTLADLPVFILFPFLYCAIAYYMVGLYNDLYNFGVACAILILVANVACSFGYLISCISTSTTMALSIATPFIIPFMLFGGFFLNKNSIPVYFKWIRYLSWYLYGNEALAINQWEKVDSIQCEMQIDCPPNGEAVLKTLNFDKGNLTQDLVCLATLFVGYRVLAFLALLSKTYRKK